MPRHGEFPSLCLKRKGLGEGCNVMLSEKNHKPSICLWNQWDSYDKRNKNTSMKMKTLYIMSWFTREEARQTAPELIILT